MTRFYRECDQYECEVCPRREDCDMREEEEESVIPLDDDALAEIERCFVEMKADIAELRIEVRRLMRHESEHMATWCRIAEGRDDG